ncbi:MAG: DUF3291 domain-containing protein, partial [Rhodobacteraceae bacterium]|nr:DUF3291 domain-containing protein [Paracoccaceae bacterium]
NTENNIGDDPQMVANMTVWEDVASLENFVWNTVHRQFYERRAEWFEVMRPAHFVMWWVPEGHQPTLGEALERLEHMRVIGDSDRAFGWKHLKEATLWQQKQCGVAAE